MWRTPYVGNPQKKNWRKKGKFKTGWEKTPIKGRGMNPPKRVEP